MSRKRNTPCASLIFVELLVRCDVSQKNSRANHGVSIFLAYDSFQRGILGRGLTGQTLLRCDFYAGTPDTKNR